MPESKNPIDIIVEGLQEKKGKNIVVVDMTNLNQRACDYFVICQGDSSTHVSAVADAARRYIKTNMHTNPYAIDGTENNQWIVMDYGNIFVHVFQPMYREFYDIEHLWEDAKLTVIKDIY